MKRLIFQVDLYTGKRESSLDLSIQTFKWYAERIGADYFCLSDPDKRELREVKPHYEIFFPILNQAIREKNYEQILCVDVDVMPLPRAADIFQRYSDRIEQNVIYLSLMNDMLPRSHQTRKFLEEGCCLKDSSRDRWPVDEFGVRWNANSGVVLFNRGAMNSITRQDILEWIKTRETKCFDQDIFNYYGLSAEKQFALVPLDCCFNYMLTRCAPDRRFSSDFIHYHQQEKILMEQDYMKLYESTPSS